MFAKLFFRNFLWTMKKDLYLAQRLYAGKNNPLDNLNLL